MKGSPLLKEFQVDGEVSFGGLVRIKFRSFGVRPSSSLSDHPFLELRLTPTGSINV